MSKQVAFIFPGQGTQYIGMGKELYQSNQKAKETFDKAGEILGFDLKKLCFEGPQEELTNTANAQVAILTHSIAALNSIKDDIYQPIFSLGLSLGEYSALVAAGAIDFEDALRLVRKRGQFMDAAAKKNPGKMASIMGLDIETVEELCKGIGCEIANLNCPGQVVVSGKETNIELIAGLAKDKGAKRAIILDVSGAFHCSLMDPAKEKLEEEIQKVLFKVPKIPVIGNVTAQPSIDPQQIKQNLIKQVNNTTYFERSIGYVISKGINSFVEIGPGKVLKGILKKIDKELLVDNVEKTEDIIEVTV
ncbi:MAG: ACP S-malonyltransferase [Candidatus Omnitrophica bacterium]|nr:ACP S-malonyltransferase [Candidatus Omnitrophota bacterium]